MRIWICDQESDILRCIRDLIFLIRLNIILGAIKNFRGHSRDGSVVSP